MSAAIRKKPIGARTNPLVKVLVVSYGNPLEDDGGLGWQVKRHLKTDDLDGTVEVLTRRLLLPELAEKINRTQLVIFVDSIAANQPGAIMCQPISSDSTLYPILPHQYDPVAFLSWVHCFYGRCPKAFLVSLIGAVSEHGQNLSPNLKIALAHLLDRIRFLIKYNLIQLKPSSPNSPALSHLTRPVPTNNSQKPYRNTLESDQSTAKPVACRGEKG